MVRKRTRPRTIHFWQEFRAFALKGNVVDLAVAVIIGGAFGKIITSFVADVVMPLVNPLIPGGDWRALTIGSGVKIGNFLGAIVDFVVVAVVLFAVIRLLLTRKSPESTTVPSEPTTEERLVLAIERLNEHLDHSQNLGVNLIENEQLTGDN
ncbi:large-conductive mechanosensitive channel [Gloeomargarita lithophora Alchichica-D10]|uniref:Large-conductance mechanosensitive channel n=1 Tax=Gloeomargarita lithophora Alchichica-D10 TaxID=1188229 RepID=A0A1J0A9N0_9CYAN|nr:large conductance mechanosensitive channel protein MscL [Gloeomargarita lithophora]APB32648.1 large-conductive mechanosensitive channel [Gloeomargarita lithophora Alchichica-D10]